MVEFVDIFENATTLGSERGSSKNEEHVHVSPMVFP